MKVSGSNVMSGWNVRYSRWMEQTNFELWTSFPYDTCRRVWLFEPALENPCRQCECVFVCVWYHHIITEDVRQRTNLHYFIRNARPGERRVSNNKWMLPFIIIRRSFRGKYSISLCVVVCRVTLNLSHVILVTFQVEKYTICIYISEAGADAHFD